jgi:DNA-binding Lrp family transcriptional regulator
VQKLKDIDRKILSLLTRHSKASDRQIAREIGVSQPTITRRSTKLEETSINTYTIVPDFLKLGYQIMAFTFVKLRSYPAAEKTEALVTKGTGWLKTYPNTIFAADSEGLGKDLIMVSFHKS